MSARLQVVISALSIPGSAFIALNRLALDRPWWALMWSLVGALHCWMLVDTVREIRAARRQKNCGIDGKELENAN